MAGCGCISTLLYGTVIKRIWWQIVLVIVYTACVVFAYTHIPAFTELTLKLNLVEILGVVTGLLLVFRTQIAYDRYWEGRNLWSKLGSTIGTLARLIWISVKVADVKDIIEKKTIMNLLSAFPLATKHYLRDEYAHEYEEVNEYLSVFPEILTKPATPDPKRKVFNRQKDLPNGKVKPDEERMPNFVAPSNASGEILYYIGAYFDQISERNMVDRSVQRLLQNSVTQLEDVLAGLEKILRTPMPLAYSLHLEHCLHIYVLALPFQLVHEMGWWSIPVVAVAGFAIIGILGIGAEIENPFGYDDNDLPLDAFCKDIVNEIRLILTLRLPKLDDWMITDRNRPCIHVSELNAIQLVETKTMDEVYDLCREEALVDPLQNNSTKSDKPISVISNWKHGDTKKY